MAARPTIVLLHGGPGAGRSLFKPEFPATADAAQVVYLDQRRSGRSDHGNPDLWTWDQWADDVVGLCRALDITASVLVGTSGGGRVAVACAGRHPRRCRRAGPGQVVFGPGSLENRPEVFQRRRGGPGGGGALHRERHEPGGSQGMGRSRNAVVRERVRRRHGRKRRPVRLNREVLARFRRGAGDLAACTRAAPSRH